MNPNRENVEKLNNIFSSNEDLEIKLLKSVEILRFQQIIYVDIKLDVSVASGGGLKATIKDDGLKVFVFKVSKGEEYESEDDATRETNEGISTFLRYSADYLEDKLIGEGAFGRAFRCTHKLDRGEYVIKKVPFNEHDREKKLKVVISLKMSQHKNVVRYYQCWTEERTLFIVMDYYPMTLKDKLVNKLEETEILHFFKQTEGGIEAYP
ncbi:hypothetical protein LIER_02325 [Lithospermum erythrorhizon]|uniref:Protein kinase domain-containing protein n=1 Tax=Lithospermum erythrorhizon TaxID=34254 RepID=A0AAV3NPR6_LITER